ncbi:MAG: ATP-binding protein [Gammaproteobacteria bacterium]|nr:ATP-binding protein [Gammaproteobacteria bacterium]
MYGLNRIIQIDGFIPGIRTVVEVDGHSIINGTNGAGKSSTLKLLSFFYGSDPSQLDSHAAGREPFIQFYLPRQTSMLIFEYVRESGLCCAVAYRHKSGTKHVYRFLEGGFTEDHFSQNNASGNAVYCKGHALKMHWKQMDLTCSQQIEIVTDYRAIIQNDSVLINRLKDSKSLRRLASSYCLGSHKTHMRYIDRICAAIISRSGNMERMKDMLADIMVEDGVVFPESPIHRADAFLAKEISSLREFEKEIPSMNKILTRHYERLNVETRLGEYGGQVKQAELDKDDEINQANDTLNGLQQQLTELESNWSSEYSKLNIQRIDAIDKVKYYKDKIINLNQQYDDYKEQEMDQKSSDLDNLGRFKDDVDKEQARYTALNEGVKEEENILNRSINAELERFEKVRKAAQQKLDNEKETRRTRERGYRDRREDISTREQSEIEMVHIHAGPERDVLIAARANEQAVASTGGYTEEERTSIASIQQQIERVGHEVEKERRLIEEKQSSLSVTKKQQDDANDMFNRAKHTRIKESERLDELHKIAFAEDGTWLKRLRENDPNWAQRLGKVINPDLLQRKDLHAEYISDDLETIFGWSLNLNAITTPQYTESEEQLRADYTIQEECVNRAKDKVEECESACEKANKRYKDVENEVNATRLVLRQKSSQEENSQRHQKDLTREINEAVADRRNMAKKEAIRLKDEIDVFDNALTERIKSIKTRFSDERSELQKSWGIEKSHFEESIDRLTHDLDDISDNHKKRKNEIRDDYKKACSEKGIDTKTIEDSKQAVDTAREKAQSIQDSAGAVNIYREWLKDQWEKRDDLTTALDNFRTQQQHADAKLNSAEHEYVQTKAAIKKKKMAENSRLIKLNDQREQINALRPRYSFFIQNAEVVSVSIPFDLLIKEVTSLLDENDDLKNKLVADIQGINNKIGQYGETQVAQAWQHAKDNLRQQLGYDDPYDRNFLINLPQALEIFVDEEVKSIKSARIESLRGIGKGLTDFFEKLRVIHNRIKDQSRKITASISENMKIDALSSMGLLLTSRIDSLDYWKSLQEFSKSWQDWRDSGERGLPDQQFLDEMSTLIGAFQSIKSGHHLRDYFDLHIRMIENGHDRIIKNDHQLDNSTSDGLKYLALCVIFIAISRQLCPDREVKLHWPIDELGILHGENIARLFSMLNQGGIVMVGGFPSEDPVMLRHFKHRQVIDFKKGIRVIDIPKSSLGERALARQGMEVKNEQIS